MISPSVFFNISNVLFLIGTSLLIRAVLKNRNILNGYDWLGSLLTLTAMICSEYAYVLFIERGDSAYWISFLFSLLTVAYWALASFYSVKAKLKGRKKKMHTTVYWFNGHGHKGTTFIKRDVIVDNIEV
jgi:Na+-transporting NADH:ubiquinone oxidoreductase subunit NqrE